MQPSEFWKLTLHDFWLEFDMRVRQGKRIQEVAEGGKSTKADDLAFARKVHREKKERLARERAEGAV